MRIGAEDPAIHIQKQGIWIEWNPNDVLTVDMVDLTAYATPSAGQGLLCVPTPPTVSRNPAKIPEDIPMLIELVARDIGYAGDLQGCKHAPPDIVTSPPRHKRLQTRFHKGSMDMDRPARDQDIGPSQVADRGEAKGSRGETAVVMSRHRATPKVNVAATIQKMHLVNARAPLTAATSKGKVRGADQTQAGDADMEDIEMHPHVSDHVDAGCADPVDISMDLYVPAPDAGPSPDMDMRLDNDGDDDEEHNREWHRYVDSCLTALVAQVTTDCWKVGQWRRRVQDKCFGKCMMFIPTCQGLALRSVCPIYT